MSFPNIPISKIATWLVQSTLPNRVTTQVRHEYVTTAMRLVRTSASQMCERGESCVRRGQSLRLQYSKKSVQITVYNDVLISVVSHSVVSGHACSTFGNVCTAVTAVHFHFFANGEMSPDCVLDRTMSCIISSTQND